MPEGFYPLESIFVLLTLSQHPGGPNISDAARPGPSAMPLAAAIGRRDNAALVRIEGQSRIRSTSLSVISSFVRS
jgi:hypothetical protein